MNKFINFSGALLIGILLGIPNNGKKGPPKFVTPHFIVGGPKV